MLDSPLWPFHLGIFLNAFYTYRNLEQPKYPVTAKTAVCLPPVGKGDHFVCSQLGRLAYYLFPVQWRMYNSMISQEGKLPQNWVPRHRLKWTLQSHALDMCVSPLILTPVFVCTHWESLRNKTDFTWKRQWEGSFRSICSQKYSYLPKTILRSNSYWQRIAGWQTGCSGNDYATMAN